MTELVLTLPDDLARLAKDAGLLSAEAIEQLLRERLRRQAGEELREMMKKLSADGAPPMGEGEVQADIDAYRTERRAALRPCPHVGSTTVQLTIQTDVKFAA